MKEKGLYIIAIMGDYDDFDDLEELISFIRTGKAEG